MLTDSAGRVFSTGAVAGRVPDTGRPGPLGPGGDDRGPPSQRLQRLREVMSEATPQARISMVPNGSEMLIAQAAIAFERWTGVSGMADVMREAVAPLLADPDAQA